MRSKLFAFCCAAGQHAALMAFVVSLSACAARAGVQQPPAASPVPDAATSDAAPASLLLQGYNYTDHYIDSFSVNGQGGGNIFESGPESGGGKSACCVAWNPSTKLPLKITVRWTASYCMRLVKTKFGDYEDRQRIFKEQDALVTERNVSMTLRHVSS